MTRAGLVLGADVGGTNARFWLADEHGVTARATLASGEHASLEAALAHFLAGVRPGPLAAAALAIAGPVEGGRCRATNLPWEVDEATLAGVSGARTRLMNDFEAAAHGLASLGPDDVETWQEGEPSDEGPRALIGAGTGLGEALVVPLGAGAERVIPTEGSHADFAPGAPEDDALLARLRARHGHVSWERVVSGPGLCAIFEHVVAAGLATPTDALLAAVAGTNEPAKVIGPAGLSGSDPAAVRALGIFARLYGAEAGNLALKCIPRGGLYVAGGIASKLGGAIREPFVAAFLDKGRMRPLLERVPVRVVRTDDLGLRGALEVARRLAASG